MTDPVAFLDLETTGLDSTRHEVWDIALILDDLVHEWHLPPAHLETADPTALRITRFYERSLPWQASQRMRPGSGGEDSSSADRWSHAQEALEDITRYTAGRHLVGAVPSFDAEFLTVAMRSYRLVPAWHYHLIDVETLAAGKFGLRPPWDSEVLSRAAGVDPAQFARHTALGDARWAKAIYEAVLGTDA